MRLPAQLRKAAATLRRRTPNALELAGLALVAYGVSMYSFPAGVIAAGLLLVIEAVTQALR